MTDKKKLSTQEKLKYILNLQKQGLTRKEIAEKLQVSVTQVSRILKRALNKLYNIIQKDLDDNNQNL